MSALDEFADNINDIVANHDARFRKLNERKQALQIRGDDIAAGWESYFADQEKQLAAAEAALNRISNIHLSSVSQTTPTSEPISQIPKVMP
jgi:hypothetical protein